MTTNVDLVVIGTGSAAQTVAYKCREADWSVAVIDSRPFGGTCQLRGCDPKKVLAGVAELVDWSWRMQGRGVSNPGLSLSWPELMRFKRTFTDPASPSVEGGFEKAGITQFHGRARFVDRTTVEVGDSTLIGRHVVIAGGARRATLGIEGEEHLTSSTEFLELEDLPRRVVFVGGGYIAFEFGHIAARAGAAVQIFHRGARPLQGFDPDLVAQLVETTRELPVDIQLDTAVEAIERRGDELVVRLRTKGETREVAADLVVHAAGRVPEIDDLDLERAGVAFGKGGVSVNEYLQSVTNPAVYAAGDAVDSGGLRLTPVAGMQGGIVARNLLKGNHDTPDYSGIPSVVFTTPTLSKVGLDEAGASELGLRFRVNRGDTSGWYSSRRLALDHTGFKVLVEEETDRVLGAHLLGGHSEEVINIFALAIRAGLRAVDLKRMVYAYPTAASDISYMV
ncbi:MAG: NAD(P)/FAD-dependent oxidoreductase [Candidatus Dormibacteria bacterium]